MKVTRASLSSKLVCLSTQTTWALYYLCQRKDIQEKLYNELKGVPTDTPTADQLADLTFLDAVVRETLRVRAAVPVTVRIAMHDDVIPVSKPYKDRYGKTHKEVRYAGISFILCKVFDTKALL